MRNTFLPFSKPSITEAEISAVGDVLRSGWITTGPKAAQFADALKETTGASEAVAMTSETNVRQTFVNARTGTATVSALDVGCRSQRLRSDRFCGLRPSVYSQHEAAVTAADESSSCRFHFAGGVRWTKFARCGEGRNITLVEDGRTVGGSIKDQGRIVRTRVFVSSDQEHHDGRGGALFPDDRALSDAAELEVRARRGRLRSPDHGRAPQAEVMEPGFQVQSSRTAGDSRLGQACPA